MRSLGCLVVIVAVCAGIYFLSGSQGLSDQDKARIVGQKVHRGWNQVQKYAHSAQEGWKSANDKADKPNTPNTPPRQ